MDGTITSRGELFTDTPEDALGIEVMRRPLVFRDRPGLRLAKRLIDLLICAAILPLVVPIMAVCALAVRLDSPGPVFFRQKRVGRGGRLFTMYKFRTMVANVDDREHRKYMKAFVTGQLGGGDGQQVFKPAEKSQVTRVGRVLRKTSLDELPQIINVLKGEMSIIGPRPNLPWEVEEYKLWQHERLEVLPGITGLAQVNGRSSIPFEKIVEYDVQYVNRLSLALDFEILARTALVIVKGLGAR